MRKIFINPAAILRRDERGQIGIIMVLILPTPRALRAPAKRAAASRSSRYVNVLTVSVTGLS